MIYFECNADEAFLKFLGFKSADLKGGHSVGRSRISSKLKNNTKCLAFIDEDPNAAKDSYLEYLFQLRPVYQDEYLMCFDDKGRHNRVIVIRPDLERWCVKVARDENVDLQEDYGLERDWRKLHDTLRIEKNVNGRAKLVQFLSDHANHKSIVKLKELIQ